MKNFLSRLFHGAPQGEVSEVSKKFEAVLVKLQQQQRITDRVVTQMQVQYKLIEAVAGEMVPEMKKEILNLKKKDDEIERRVSLLETGKHKRRRIKSQTMEALVYSKLDGEEVEL